MDETDYLAFGLFYTHFLSLVSFSSSGTYSPWRNCCDERGLRPQISHSIHLYRCGCAVHIDRETRPSVCLKLGQLALFVFCQTLHAAYLPMSAVCSLAFGFAHAKAHQGKQFKQCRRMQLRTNSLTAIAIQSRKHLFKYARIFNSQSFR